MNIVPRILGIITSAANMARLFVYACLCMTSLAASAAVTSKDLQIVARTLGFLETPLTGDLNVGIVHDPDNTSSRQQAESIADMLGSGLRVGNLQLRPVLVPIAEIANAQVDFFLMTEFIGEASASLPALLNARKLPCITTDMQQVRNGICVIGVQSAPKVEIVVNRSAASLNATSFSTVFRMMITEL